MSRCPVCFEDTNTTAHICQPRPVVTKIPHKCPCCDGTGKVSRPPWVPGDQQTWSSSGTTSYKCQACDGSGIVWGEA